ncbi:MAG: hypothetical protein JW954_05145 [Dehalococcoidaceae bacterium]|nr:hypothetical protein [Dehalococcoidaceae bacterium]
MVENTGESLASCDIPVTFTDRSDAVTTYMINASLDPGETKQIAFDEVILPRDIFIVRAGNISNSFQVG